MDHFQAYVTTKLNLLEIPVLRNKRFAYDGLGFDDFPKRVSFDVSELWRPSTTTELSDWDRLSFLQSWLYFAFAHEVFGRILEDTAMPLLPDILTTSRTETIAGQAANPLGSVADTLQQNLSPETFVNSASLTIAATAWMALHELTTHDDSIQRMLLIVKLLKHVHNILRAVTYAMDGGQLQYLEISTTSDDKEQLSLPCRILISILLLAEQIDLVFDSIYADPRISSRCLGWPFPERLVVEYLKLTRVCRTELSYIVRTSPTPNSLAVWQYLMLDILPQRDHRECEDSVCRAVKPMNQPRHVTPGCQCSSVSLPEKDQMQLRTFIQEERMAVLFVDDTSENGNPQAFLRVSEFRPQDKASLCIVVSHVWSDGLGNSRENAMPACQLLKIQKYANNIAKQWGAFWDYQTTSVGFWIDTICVPRDPSLKKQAILQMGSVYKNASAVMVLDKDLESITTDPGTLTVMWQIYTSTWYRRLWTLQEGILNTFTIVVLADDFPTYEWFFHSYDESETLVKPLREYREFIRKEIFPGRTPILLEFSPQLLDPIYRMLRLDILETRRTISEPYFRGFRLLHQLAWRNTTESRDEKVCLAVLTDFPLKTLLSKSPDEQLALLMDHVGPLPKQIVFMGGPRLDLPGHRWIPKSFLNQQKSIRYYLGDTEAALPTPEGLVVELPGLVQKNKAITMRVAMPGAAFLTDSKLVLNVEGEEIHVMAIDGPEGFYEAFFLGDLGGLILTEQDLKERRTSREINGCVASIVKFEEDITYVTPMKVCKVRRLQIVHDSMELATDLGIRLERDDRKPILDEGALWGASMSSEAEFLPPRRYCLG